MLNRRIRESLCASLVCASMALSMIPAPMFAKENASDHDSKTEETTSEKSETVYSFVDGDGNISKTIVSAWLHNDKGIQGISETLHLSDVKNVKTDEEPVVSGDTYTWSVQGNDVYYQGTASQKPPVTISIDYKLDGKEIKASQLKGKSGHLKTTIHFDNHESKTVTVKGKPVVIHPAFLAGGMMDLDNEVFTNVTCTAGKSINDGDKEFLLFATVPGLAGTLESAGLEELADKTEMSDDVIIEADVRDFSLPALYIGAASDFDLNELTEIDSMEELTGQMQQLFDGADQLKDGAGQLADGLAQLKDGISPLGQAGGKITMLADGIVRLDQGSGELAKGVRDYAYGVKQLNDGNSQLYQISDGVSQMRQVINAKGSLKEGAAQLSAGLSQLNGQVSSIDASKLNGLKDQLDQAMGALQQLSALMDQDLAALQTMQQTLDGAAAQAEGIGQNIQTSASSIAVSVASDAKTIAADNQLIASANDSFEASRAAASSSLVQAQNELAALKQANPDLDTTALEAALANAQTSISSAAGLQTLTPLAGMNPQDLQTLNQSLQALQSMSSQLGDSMQTLTKLKGDLDASIQTLTKLKGQLQAVSSSQDFNALLQQLETLKQAAAQLDAGGKAVSQGIQTLDDNLAVLETRSKTAFDQLNAGSNKLNASSGVLIDGADAIKAGTTTMAASKDQLASLQSGISTLTDAVDQLNAGAAKLKEGAATFDEQGMQKLKDVLGWGEEELEAFRTICNETIRFTESYSNFAGAPDNAKTSVKYIFKMEDEQ